jgi:hypothetical protein
MKSNLRCLLAVATILVATLQIGCAGSRGNLGNMIHQDQDSDYEE